MYSRIDDLAIGTKVILEDLIDGLDLNFREAIVYGCGLVLGWYELESLLGIWRSCVGTIREGELEKVEFQRRWLRTTQESLGADITEFGVFNNAICNPVNCITLIQNPNLTWLAYYFQLVEDAVNLHIMNRTKPHRSRHKCRTRGIAGDGVEMAGPRTASR